MNRKLALFLAKLAVFSVVLCYVWFKGLQEAYPEILSPIAIHIIAWFGAKKWLLFLLMDHFTNLIPFIALVAATPLFFVRWRKTLTVVLVGLSTMVVLHLAISIVFYHFYEAYGFSETFYKLTVPVYLINDALPFVLWILFYHGMLGELFGLRRGVTQLKAA